VSTEASARVRAAAAARGTAFLASPVSGNGKVVSAGMLSLVCSGPREAYDELAPVLDLLGRHVTYVGDGEHARLVKICHNIFLGVVAQNLAEITVLAEKGGVSRAALLDFINNSVMGSVFSRYKSPAYVNLDFTPTFTPVLLRKDLDLGLRAADELGVPMPVTAAARETVQAAVAQGRTTEDFAVLLELQARNSGLELVAEDVEAWRSARWRRPGTWASTTSSGWSSAGCGTTAWAGPRSRWRPAAAGRSCSSTSTTSGTRRRRGSVARSGTR
jgi:6-phosphogluconate dehydrogenase